MPRKQQRTLIAVVEGEDYSGKTTITERLETWFNGNKGQREMRVLRHREPGGTRWGEAMRSLLLDRASTPTPIAAMLAFASSRASFCQMLVEQIQERKPDVILLDRFIPSTYAYQLWGELNGKIPFHAFRDLMLLAIRPLDELQAKGQVEFLNLGIEVKRAELERRRSERGGGDRYETKDKGFQTRLRKAYTRLRAAHTRNILSSETNTLSGRSFVQRYLALEPINGNRPVDQIVGELGAQIWRAAVRLQAAS